MKRYRKYYSKVFKNSSGGDWVKVGGDIVSYSSIYTSYSLTNLRVLMHDSYPRLISFGRAPGNGFHYIFNDVWEYDGSKWTQVTRDYWDSINEFHGLFSSPIMVRHDKLYQAVVFIGEEGGIRLTHLT